ncbi:MBL fold metallo-hydrolase [Streptomyces hoynatensis]|uniref:MBL fold metallo-hydrolase n=1 Tax=Streptomyces hoynatensis TaxID=1141874 RepID=A0A3A9Z3S2_9ACTN|nr:MBL fold metallo-hydrolase [Streptomyces hoynatensis]RKN42933.1 MBL fold metallo-hydrolase [Streptomyces hoynatensis]
MRLVVLGGSGAWPTAERARSGYLVEHAGFRLLLDPGYGTLQALLTHGAAERIDAVLVTHGHPDHCADLNPLLRARALRDQPPPRLPVFAPHGALDAVLALDRPGMLEPAYRLGEFTPGERLEIGPFAVETRLLPHHLPNAGLRVAAGGAVVAYTGDTGPTPELLRLAEGADVFLCEATYVRRVPEEDAPYLMTARLAGEYAAAAGAARLLLTHLWPGTDPAAAVEAAGAAFGGPKAVALPGLVAERDPATPPGPGA